MGISHVLPHCDPAVFPSPLAFKPERFLAPPSAELRHRHHRHQHQDRDVGGVAGSAFGLGPYELTTFSHGTHVCPGQRLVRGSTVTNTTRGCDEFFFSVSRYLTVWSSVVGIRYLAPSFDLSFFPLGPSYARVLVRLLVAACLSPHGPLLAARVDSRHGPILRPTRGSRKPRHVSGGGGDSSSSFGGDEKTGEVDDEDDEGNVDNGRGGAVAFFPPIDFTRATLAQRAAPVAMPYRWRQ